MKPTKNKNTKKKNKSMSKQKMCFVYVVLHGNHLKTRKVTLCGLGGQEKPANVKVLLPINTSLIGGCVQMC